MINDTHISTIEKGLTSAEALELQNKFGKNVLPIKKIHPVFIFLRQFKSAIVLLMLIAACISLIVHDVSGAVIIAVIIIVNTLVGFYQEFRAERKLYDISTLVQPMATVKRDGIFQQILRVDIVKGDIVQLTPGTIAPADIELIYSDGLSINESAVSGESLDVEKNLLHDKKVEMGTTVSQGIGEGIVTAIGKEAMLGMVINLVETSRPTTFEKQIRKLTELCIGIIVVSGIALFAAKLYFNPHQALSSDFLIFLLAIGIGILPESLPLITTVALSNGAMSLSKKNVVVRTLSAIQDLGSISVLCSDKTGTLTENSLSVADSLICDQEAFILITSIANSLQGIINDPYQLAISHLSNSKKIDVSLLHSVPFDASKRCASFIVKNGNQEITITQGAHDVVAEKNHGLCSIDQVQKWITTKESKGERILAFSIKDSQSSRIAAYVSFADPIRATAKKAIVHARDLGVAIKMISGDSELVTASVAMQLGIVKSNADVISGKMWEAASKEEKKRMAKEHVAFARFYPVQKYELIHILQQQGEIVGYMGDGVNDAPSLRLADVGICVANGTDIAKSASDIILLKQGLNVVITGIQHGRSIFENISKYLRETLTENLGNFLSISVLSFFIPYLPMLPVQILVTNLLADFPQLSIATDNVDPSAISKPRHFKFRLLVRFMFILSIISSGADMAFFYVFHAFPEALVQSGWFVFSTLTELCTVYSVRSRKLAFQGVGPSKMLAISSLLIVGATLSIVYIPQIGSRLHLIALPFSMLGIVSLIAFFYFLLFDFVKKQIYTFWPESY